MKRTFPTIKATMRLSALLLLFIVGFLSIGLAQNVGIGVSNPQSKLDIDGDLRIGNHTANLLAGKIRYRAREFEGWDSVSWIPLHSLWTRATGDNIYKPLGTVGIGWADPTSNFGIQSTGSAMENIIVKRDDVGNVLKVIDLSDATYPFLLSMDRVNTNQAYVRFAVGTNYPDQFTLMRNGKVGFGTNTPGIYNGISSCLVEFVDNDPLHSDWGLRVANDASNGYPAVIFAKSRGIATAPTIVTNGHMLGGFLFTAWDGNNNFASAAEIRAEVDGNTGASDMPGRLLFFTTADGSGSSSERMRITQRGYTGINTQTPLEMLDVNGRLLLEQTTAPATTTNRLYNVGGTLYWNGSTIGSAGSSALSSITAATAANSINNANFLQTWNWNTATTGNAFALTGNTITTGSLLDISTTNTSSNSTNGLLRVINSSTSTSGTVFRAQSNSTAGTGLTVLANGNVGIETASPSSTFSVGGSNEFQVNTTGNIVKINNVTTSFPTSQGAADTYLKNDGTGTLSWGGPSGPANVQVFTSGSGTYTTPADVTAIVVELIGGGGGSGGVAASGGTTGAGSAGGGGGGGGYTRKLIVNPNATYAYTVGAGGAAGASGNNAGSIGSTSSFGTITALGGSGGSGGGTPSTGTFAAGGLGAAQGANGDFMATGGTGGPGVNLPTVVMSGQGGKSLFGGGDNSGGSGNSNVTVAGVAGLIYGGGASGAYNHESGTSSQAAKAGAAGATGIIIVTAYK